MASWSPVPPNHQTGRAVVEENCWPGKIRFSLPVRLLSPTVHDEDVSIEEEDEGLPGRKAMHIRRTEKASVADRKEDRCPGILNMVIFLVCS
mmetsp:Transcript_15962/g.23166  ORF Transcript_15962/g.23166 Transcript_15962/m.23166 type:complete len:92 (-) Transcript_15962:105-380(-)